ncbi:MAG: LuxR family transcriptional regulator [Parvibaculaceae bacterium]
MVAELRDYRAKLDHATDFQQALDKLFEIASGFGFTQVLYAYQSSPPQLPGGEWLPLKLNVRNFPRGWERGWLQYMSIDPYYHACFDGTLPFLWSDVQDSERLSSGQRAAWKYLADFGLSRGMTIPVHLPFGRFAVVSAIIDRSRADHQKILSEARERMFHLTHLFHQTIHEKHFESQVDHASPTRLTSRELECLSWAAAGKTSYEISSILNISMETVRLHIKKAILKLNASNRNHAIAKASQLGIIADFSIQAGRAYN